MHSHLKVLSGRQERLDGYITDSGEKTTFFLVKLIAGFLRFGISTWIAGTLGGIRYQFIMSQSLAYDGVGKAVYNDYLLAALSEKRYSTAWEPFVGGKGLDCIQAALDLHRQGMSARKLVVSLSLG